MQNRSQKCAEVKQLNETMGQNNIYIYVCILLRCPLFPKRVGNSNKLDYYFFFCQFNKIDQKYTHI